MARVSWSQALIGCLRVALCRAQKTVTRVTGRVWGLPGVTSEEGSGAC